MPDHSANTQPSVPDPDPGEAIPVEEAITPPNADGDDGGAPPERVETKEEALRKRTAGDL